MRPLEDKEKELTEKGIERLKKENVKLKENLEYNWALILKQKTLREFDDRFRDYLRKQKDEEDNKILELINNEIKLKEDNIEIMEKQLIEGVEPKEIIHDPITGDYFG